MADVSLPLIGGQAPNARQVLGWVARGEVALAIGIVGIIVLLILPVPAFMLDMLLAISIISSVLILMTSLLIKKPLEFTAFPTVLLMATLFRLGLNVASTRLILGHGHEGTDGAGHIIQAFGELMMHGNFVIGVIIFAILVIVNFVVVTRGSSRIAEVAARFTLDSMPGKQMAIDADLSSGLIDQDTAKLRRKELEQEFTFFGAMDGASKFVRGDAMAGLLIVAINVVGGILVGVVQHKLPLDQAFSSYTIMTIGDGLVSQIPSLVISIAAGLLVSKSGVEGSADKALVAQLAMNPISLGMVSAAAGVLGFIPGMPIFPFAALSIGAGVLAWRRSQAKLKPAVEAPKVSAEPKEEPIAASLAMDDVKVELGYGLLHLINDNESRRLTDQIRALDKTLAADFGFVMPPVRLLDNMRLGNQGYAIRIKEMESGVGEVRLGKLMAMDSRGGQVELPGEHVREPAFGLPATWIDESLREEATFRGYTTVDPATVLTTHLTEILKENMPDLLSYGEVQKLLKDLTADEKKLVEDLIPSVATASTVQRVLQALLKERVSIRDLSTILEGIAEAAPHSSSIVSLVEQVRARLGRQICWANRGDDGALPIVALSPDWETAFGEALIGQGDDKQLALAPSKLQEFIRLVRETFERAALQGESPVLLTSPLVRPYIRSIVERFRGQTVVMSQNEIHPKARLKTLGTIYLSPPGGPADVAESERSWPGAITLGAGGTHSGRLFMRSASPLIAAGIALAVVGQAFAQGTTPPASGTSAPASSGPAMTSPHSPATPPASSPSSATPPAASNGAPADSTANSAATSGANTSATTAATAPLTVGETVKDNTGATIGSISALNAGTAGAQMAVIKMGTETFQVPSDRLGNSNGVAEINMTQAQITAMLHPATGSH